MVAPNKIKKISFVKRLIISKLIKLRKRPFLLFSLRKEDKLLCILEINSHITEMFDQIYINEHGIKGYSFNIYLWLKINDQIVISLSDSILSQYIIRIIIH